MRNLLTLIIFAPIFSFGQNLEKEDWSEAILINKQGDSLVTDILIDNQFFEGTIICKYGDEYKSVSPESIKEFYVYDEMSQDTIQFKSRPTRFLGRPGSKKSFLKVIFQGSSCSLYAKHIPNVRSGFFILPIPAPGGWVVYGVASYLADEEVLFIEYNDKAFQFTEPRNEELYANRFKSDKKLFFDVIRDKRDEVKEYMKEHKLQLKKRNEIVQVIKYIDTVAESNSK